MTNNSRVLVIDDEQLSREIIVRSLVDKGFEVIQAIDGNIAIDILKTDSAFDVIILDKMMPNLDGIEVLKIIKDDECLKHIPVIMQTGASSNNDIQAGLEAGVYYYLTKPFELKILLSIVTSAINNTKYHKIISDIKHTSIAINLIESGKFRFRNFRDVGNLSTLIANLCPNPDKVILGISELMVNAVEHGNLEITYDEKTQLLLENKLHQEILTRLESEKYRDRDAHLFFERQQDFIEITIEDEGNGFNFNSYLDLSINRAIRPNGRGIAMAKALSFDYLQYVDKGNKVICRINI